MSKCSGNFTISMLQDHIELYLSRKSMNLMDTTSDNNYTKVNLWIIHIIVCQHDAGGRGVISGGDKPHMVWSKASLAAKTCKNAQCAAHPLSARKCVAHSHWKEAEAARLKKNEARRTVHKDQLKLWEAERDRAQLERQRPAWNKPKLGKLEAPLPRPMLNDPEAYEEQQDRCDEGDAD